MPSYEDRDKLPYIETIVEEVLRWHPIASAGISHRNMVEDTYQGQFIPQGSIIVPNHWAIGRDESMFGKSLDDFVSERWLPDETSPGTKKKLEVGGALKDMPTIGFGYGRKICPGRHIARNSIWLQVARLLWAFDIQSAGPAPDPMEAVTSILTMPLPYRAVFKSRGSWVISIISSKCNTWREDVEDLLDRIAKDKSARAH